ncbi:hypothetical protein RFI_30890 [Reticulomyxa filosa]|uniref:Uncharacterized protein n=1 Tax=Reticulomyxa filosa TaxID=46433 RepID=X6LX38_RETFI|nr:hypothetical protein RFI_30890 [Reticulomyxa filosa]|eukprot:ETO06503.1 hypothetical protein RFI_30890 [Reticulomyxa filosa]
MPQEGYHVLLHSAKNGLYQTPFQRELLKRLKVDDNEMFGSMAFENFDVANLGTYFEEKGYVTTSDEHKGKVMFIGKVKFSHQEMTGGIQMDTTATCVKYFDALEGYCLILEESKVLKNFSSCCNSSATILHNNTYKSFVLLGNDQHVKKTSTMYKTKNFQYYLRWISEYNLFELKSHFKSSTPDTQKRMIQIDGNGKSREIWSELLTTGTRPLVHIPEYALFIC